MSQTLPRKALVVTAVATLIAPAWWAHLTMPVTVPAATPIVVTPIVVAPIVVAPMVVAPIIVTPIVALLTLPVARRPLARCRVEQRLHIDPRHMERGARGSKIRKASSAILP